MKKILKTDFQIQKTELSLMLINITYIWYILKVILAEKAEVLKHHSTHHLNLPINTIQGIYAAWLNGLPRLQQNHSLRGNGFATACGIELFIGAALDVHLRRINAA